MKAILSILTTFAAVMLIASEPPSSKVKHDKTTYFTVNDTAGLFISETGAGVISVSGAIIGIGKDTSEVIALGYIADTLKGIAISDIGKVITISAEKIIISRKTFTSHEAADAALAKGEEYYLQGDRLVYRKP